MISDSFSVLSEGLLMDDSKLEEDALEYHASSPAGKIAIIPTRIVIAIYKTDVSLLIIYIIIFFIC